MNRSRINGLIRDTLAFFDDMKFRLPPFAKWTPDDWRGKGQESAGVVTEQLGWDITDFGSGCFDEVGLFLFTIRNGTVEGAKSGGKDYAEKIMVVQEKQVTPSHYHKYKMEDIINRGGGNLVIRLWNSNPDGSYNDSDIQVSLDSVKHSVKMGETVSISPGESICLPPGLYHEFWAEGGKTLVGEVSRTNDDHSDNFFYEPVGRFPDIVEDEAPVHLLVGDYPNYFGKG